MYATMQILKKNLEEFVLYRQEDRINDVFVILLLRFVVFGLFIPLNNANSNVKWSTLSAYE